MERRSRFEKSLLETWLTFRSVADAKRAPLILQLCSFAAALAFQCVAFLSSLLLSIRVSHVLLRARMGCTTFSPSPAAPQVPNPSPSTAPPSRLSCFFPVKFSELTFCRQERSGEERKGRRERRDATRRWLRARAGRSWRKGTEMKKNGIEMARRASFWCARQELRRG